jgi:hypothetical protein
LLELIAKDPQWSARVSRASLRILRNEWGVHTHRKALSAALWTRKETPCGTHGVARGTRALPAEMEIFREVEQDENVIDRIAAAHREELEREIDGLQAEAERVAEEARELAGEVPF